MQSINFTDLAMCLVLVLTSARQEVDDYLREFEPFGFF